MTVNNSESLFRDYLNKHSILYEEKHIVGNEANPKNVDFIIRSSRTDIYLDVKEVKEMRGEDYEINAHANIRKDIKKLREKFGSNRPVIPLVLVTMNFSSKFFTGLTVARALLGDIGMDIDLRTNLATFPPHHLSRGNAVLTEKYNRTISAVLVYDRANDQHFLFTSPYADHPVPSSYFPDVDVISLQKDADENKLKSLSKVMFCPYQGKV